MGIDTPHWQFIHHPIHLISRMTHNTTSANSLTTQTDDPPTQPCADTLALELLWKNRATIQAFQEKIAELQSECSKLERAARKTMSEDVAVPFRPGYVAICHDLDGGPIWIYLVEGQ